MLYGSGCAGRDAGQWRAVAVGLAGSAGVLNLLAMILDHRADLVVIIIDNYRQDSLRTGRDTSVVVAFNALVGVDDDEKIPRAVLVSVVGFH